MDFERRAQKAFQRGDTVRAVIVLVEGLKQRPGSTSALEQLVDYYTEGIDSPGLEHDVVSALKGHDYGEAASREIQRRLTDEGREAMARDFGRAARESGFDLSEPDDRPAEPEAKPVEPVRESEPSDNAASTQDAPERPAESTDVAAPTDDPTEESDRGAPTPTSTAGEHPSTPRMPAAEQPRQPEEPSRKPPEQNEPEAEAPPDDESPETGGEGWVRRVVAIGVGLAVAAGIGLVAWQWSASGRAELVLDGHLRELDPTRTDQIEKAVRWGRKSGIGKSAIRERRWFVESIRALERGESYRLDAEPTTTWGLSARAIASLSRGELEPAVRAATRLDRSEHPNELARLWTNARVAEYRGRISEAVDLYARAREQFPEFVPFYTGSIRLAVGQFDADELDELLEQLRSRSPEHPYLALGNVDWPTFLGGGDGGEAASEGSAEAPTADQRPRSAFLRMLRDYRRAHGAIVDRKYGLAERIAGRVLEERADFGPALWIHAAASAALFDVESADEAFGHLVELPRLAEEYRLRLQALAPRLLTGAGRPDLGAKYILSGGGHIPLEPTGVPAADGEEGEGERHPEAVVSRTAKWADQPVESPRMRRLEAAARSARIRVLMELGHLERARRYLQGLADERADRRRFRLLRAELTARGGRRTAGPGEWRWSDAGPPARLVDSFYVGKFDRAIEVGRRMLEEGTSMRVVRLVALSYASTDRGRRALQVLSNRAAAVADAPDRERVRARILARLSNEEESVASVVNQFEQIAPRSTEAQVDLAAIMLWKHRIGAAETWSEAALVQAPDYPEANWMRGLVLRLRDERGAAKRYLRRSWRTTGGDGRLDLELGYVNLALQKWKRARDLFYRALLADPSSLEAIRGLGRAYHRLDPDEGRWNFQRILENYEGRASRALHAAEVLRWLAVFRGSREGKARGRSYLERARKKAGDRAFILLEFARFYEARGDGQKAHDLYVEALEKDSTVASAHLGLARVARADGREQLMRTHLQRYLDLQPAGQHAGWARAKLKELSGRPSDD